MDNSIQNEYHPNYAPPPGEILLEEIELRGITPHELAERLALPPPMVQGILNGKQSLTPEIALQLEEILGISASFWNNLEKFYSEYLMRQKEEKQQIKTPA